jgi:hypothetical protein
MSSNFRDFEIETVDGKIQNVSSLCSYIKSTLIEPDDLPYLESLCNKLANDDSSNNVYTNEYPLVDTLHEVLLEYYIKNYGFDLDQVIDVLEVYNKAFINIDKKMYDEHIYILFDRYDDMDIVPVKDEKQFIDLVLTNLKTFVAGSFEEIFELMDRTLQAVDFNETEDEQISDYKETFDIDSETYHGVDTFKHDIYKIKNGIFIKNGSELDTLVTPTLMDREEHIEHKVVSINKKYQGFDLEDFVTLRDKAMSGDLEDEAEVQRFYYEVRYLINTMSKRDGLDSEETEELDIYMESLIQIYNNHKDILTPADKRNVQNYLDNKKKYTRKLA